MLECANKWIFPFIIYPRYCNKVFCHKEIGKRNDAAGLNATLWVSGCSVLLLWPIAPASKLSTYSVSVWLKREPPLSSTTALESAPASCDWKRKMFTITGDVLFNEIYKNWWYDTSYKHSPQIQLHNRNIIASLWHIQEMWGIFLILYFSEYLHRSVAICSSAVCTEMWQTDKMTRKHTSYTGSGRLYVAAVWALMWHIPTQAPPSPDAA